MKLKEFLQGKAQTEFKVKRVEMRISQTDNSQIAVLYVDGVIPHVIGSQSLTDDMTDETMRLQAWDVEQVFIHERDMGDDDGITINPDGTGEVKSNLVLDVSNRDEVWLRKKSLAQFGNERRQERRSERRSGLINKMNERKTRAAFPSPSQNGKVELSPTPVAEIKEKNEIDPVKQAEELKKTEVKEEKKPQGVTK